MKKRILFGLLFIIIASLAYADVVTYVSGPSIRVSMISQNPDPVQPGDYVELRWMVYNMGSTPLENVEFKLNKQYPFEFLGGDDGLRSLGTIQGNQHGEEGVVLYYKVRVNDAASEGTNKLALEYRSTTVKDWAKLDDYDIRIQSVDAALVIEDVKVDPARIPAGNSGKVTIKNTNLADSIMENINVKLDLTLETIPQPVTSTDATELYNALPFVPTNSASEKHIQSIKPGESKFVSYNLATYPDAVSKVYKVPVTITYRDEIDTEYTINDIIGIVIGSEPDLYVVIDSTDLLAGKKNGVVSFKFVNRGITDVKFLDVTLKDTENYQIISASEEYIGNLDSDDFESIDFSVYLKNNANAKNSESIEFPLHIEYKDANNVQYSKNVTVKHRINTALETGSGSSSSAMIIVVAVILIVVVYVGYRLLIRRKKKKD
jgi:hypothetical protein